MEKFQIVSFDSTIGYGQVNTDQNFYPLGTTLEERRRTMRADKDSILKSAGFSSYKQLFIAMQKRKQNADKYSDGYCYELTPENIAQFEDLYDLDVYADIVKVNPQEGTMNVAIGFPVADCAAIKAYDIERGTILFSHCGGEQIDRYLVPQTIDAMGNVSEKNIVVYTSPFAHTLYYPNPDDLKWATNDEIWKPYKTEDELGAVTVNVSDALMEQLIKRKIPVENIHISPVDTRTSDLCFSNSMAEKNPEKNGRILSGIGFVGSAIPVFDDIQKDNNGVDYPVVKVLKRF